ncbi:MAG: VanZ family protein [Gammaproteobacteria bacterium]|nr:MAG: VanZ family protein [Gammaproteobacteria bacterium]
MSDKIWHAISYGILTLWFCGVYARDRVWSIAISVFSLGLLLELAQSFTGTRFAEMADLFANLSGIIAALILARLGADRWCAMVESAFNSTA